MTNISHGVPQVNPKILVQYKIKLETCPNLWKSESATGRPGRIHCLSALLLQNCRNPLHHKFTFEFIITTGNEQQTYRGVLQFYKLSVRRHRTDLIETYAYIKNKYKTPPQSLFSVPKRSLCGHNEKIFKPRARTDIQKYFLSLSCGTTEFIVLWCSWFRYCGLLPEKIDESCGIQQRRLIDQVTKPAKPFLRVAGAMTNLSKW